MEDFPLQIEKYNDIETLPNKSTLHTRKYYSNRNAKTSGLQGLEIVFLVKNIEFRKRERSTVMGVSIGSSVAVNVVTWLDLAFVHSIT